MDRNFRKEAAQISIKSPPSEAWLFAQAILGKSIPSPSRARAEARAEREKLEWLAEISPKHADQLRKLQNAEAEARRQRELLEWLAQISDEHEYKLRTLLREEAETREAYARWEQFFEDYIAQEAQWDPAKHPRLGGSPNPGWWAATGGSGSASTSTSASGPIRTVPHRPDQMTTKLAMASGAASPTWPAYGPSSSWLPKVGSGAVAGAGAAGGVVAGGLLGGLRNASMGAYWARIPGTQAMPGIWAYELEKRVRAGKLSHEDAVEIFNTAVLGAEAQGFQPTGGTMSAVHKSATDFLGQAEAVYFARKKKAAEAEGKAGAEGAEAKPERVTGNALEKVRKEFEGMKRRLWKEEAEKNPQKYTPEQLDKMRRGDAPKGSDGRPMEIHHKKPLTEGGTNTWDNFEFLTQTTHRRKPNFKPNHPNLPRGRNR